MSRIAIVGMACRVPGAGSVHDFWRLVMSGSSGIRSITLEDLVAQGYELDPQIHNSWVPRAATLDNCTQFDAAAFGMSNADAANVSSSDGVFLETVAQALDDAGIDPTREGSDIGVFASAGRVSPDSLSAFVDRKRPPKSTEVIQRSFALDNDFLSTRVAYQLDLRGPAMTVQSGCSSSLVAVHLACQSLVTRECRIAIAGGVNIESPQGVGYYYQPGSIWSPDGYCRPFDDLAAGTVPGSGVGAVVLKRLEDAVADGNSIYAVIRASALNNDGSSKVGFAAPSVAQQVDVVQEALKRANVRGEEIGFIETHGTGTAVGDLVEWSSLERALGADGVQCAVGASKANVGHLGPASGVVGLIKAALVVRHGMIPPVAEFQTLNSAIRRTSDRLWVPKSATCWPRPEGGRYAGVSSMGVGGTNAHVILEDAPPTPVALNADDDSFILPVSAGTSLSLQEISHAVRRFASESPDELESLQHTLIAGRRMMTWRQAYVVSRRNRDLEFWQTTAEQARTGSGTLLVFPGQGSELGYLATSKIAVTGYEQVVSSTLRGLTPKVSRAVHAAIENRSENGLEPWLHELSLVAQSVVAARLVTSGLRSRVALCGYSLGELAVAVVSGVASLADIAEVLRARWKLLRDAPPGGMLRVRLAVADAENLLSDDVSIGIIPTDRDTILSGARESLADIYAQVSANRVPAAWVPAKHAFHSDLLKPYYDDFLDVWRQVVLSAPAQEVISPIAGSWLSEETARNPAAWASHLVSTVQFARAIDIARDEGFDVAQVIDSGTSLVPFVKRAFGARTLDLPRTSDGGYNDMVRKRLCASAWVGGQLETLSDDLVGSRSLGRSDRASNMLHAPGYVFDRSGDGHVSTNITSEATSVEDPGLCEPAHHPTSIVSKVDSPAESRVQPERAFLPALISIVAGLLDCDPLDVDPAASFFELGFDSFLLIQLADQTLNTTGVGIPVQLLFGELDTCRSLADYVSEQSPGAATQQDDGDEHVSRRGSTVATIAEGSRFESEEFREPQLTSDARPKTDDRDPRSAAIEGEYARRTVNSKRASEEDRYALADQRNLMSFRHARREASYPIVGVRGSGARFVDADGREYIDLCMGFGVHMLGHSPEPLRNALSSLRPDELLIGPQSAVAGGVARGICGLTGVDRVAFTSSGTEAVMAAVRATRATTRRDLIAVFAGSYHGGFDGVSVAPKTGGRLGESAPIGAGTTANMISDVLVLPYDESAIEILDFYGERVAGVLVEPIQSRRPGYQPAQLLKQLREWTSAHGTALIFDEIVTGFRSHLRGASALFDVRPDLVTYGKVIGGGMPIGVVGGDQRFMAAFDGGRWSPEDRHLPQRPGMLFAGTFNKHPLTMAVARNVVDHLRRHSPELQRDLARRTATLAERVNLLAAEQGYPLEVEGFGGVFKFNVGGSPLAVDMFFVSMLNKGVYVWEGRTCFLSSAHTDAVCDDVFQVVSDAAAEIAASGLWANRDLAGRWGESASAGKSTPRESNKSPTTLSGVASAPLTDGQKLLWAAQERGGRVRSSYCSSVAFRFETQLDVERLRRAIEAVVSRHEVMRLEIEPDGVAQRVRREVAIDIDIVALQSDDAEAASTLIQEYRDATPSDVLASPFRFQLLTAPGATVIHVTAPHHVTDDWSSGVIWRELGAIYDDSEAGSALGSPGSYLDFATSVSERELGAYQENLRYWREALGTAWASMPAARGPGPWSVRATRATLTSESAESLRRRAKDAGCSMHTASLGVFSAALRRAGVSSGVALAHVAGQSSLMRGPMVGFGVSLLPIDLSASGSSDEEDQMTYVRDAIVNAWAHVDGIYRVLRHEPFSAMPANLFAFNFSKVENLPTFDGHAAVPLRVVRDVAPWPAVVTIEENGDDVGILLEVSTDSGLFGLEQLLIANVFDILGGRESIDSNTRGDSVD